MATTSDKKVNVVLTVNSANFSAGINQLKGKLTELSGTSKNTSHSMVTDVQATSGALRLMEGGMTGNIRAAERFLASIKGVGAALQFIYPAIGIIAVGSVIAKAATELINFTKKTKEAGAEFRASFQEMQNSARLSNDELAKTNINLENQIAILTGKHENVAAAELIEARIQADNLAISAAHAAKEMKELLEKGQGSFLTKAISAGGSNELFGNINNFQDLKSQARQDQEDALHGGDTKGAAAASARYDQLIKNERAYLQRQRDFRSGTGDRDGAFSGNQSTNLTAINGALGLNYSQSDRTDEDAQNLIDSTAWKKVEAARKFSEQQKAAAAMQMAGYDKQFSSLTGSLVPGSEEQAGQFDARKLTEEAIFWSQKLSLAKHGSLVYQDIQEKLAEIDVRANQQYATAVNEHIHLAKEREKFISQSFGSDLDLTRNSDVMGELKGGGKDAGTMLTAMNEGVSIARSNADAWSEAQIQISEAAGTLGKYDAALQTLQLHRQQNDRANSDLASSRAALEQRYGPEASATTPEARAAYAQLNNQQAGLSGQYRVQSAQDQQNVSEQTPLGAWKTALDQFVQQSRDTATQVRDIWSSALSGVNDEIVKIISTKHNYNTRVEFGNLGASMFRNIASAGLQKGEGALLGAIPGLGGGKADGSQGKPFHVIMAGIGGAASSAAGSIGSAVSKAAGGIGGFIGKIAGIASGLGFAGGGMPPVGMASLVGENGPELFVPHTAGTVVPNGGFGGGNTHITLGGMDLRGASDPAAFEAIANRVFSKHVPSMISASMQAQRESHARKPSSARS
jgi:lambda family phage tail tape measure protein